MLKKPVLLILLCCSHFILAQQAPEPLGQAVYPAANPFSEAKRILGKALFWDEQLSSDNSIACGTCHLPGSGGADNRLSLHPGADRIFGTADDISGSAGIVLYDQDLKLLAHDDFGYGPQVTGRAAPSVLTAMYADELFWDGRAGSEFVDPLTGLTLIETGAALETQALAPILNSAEMAKTGRTWQEVTGKLEAVPPLALASDLPSDLAAALAGGETYPLLFELAFGDDNITPARIAMAIATYERTLVPDQTPWDRFTQGNPNAMTADQRAGWDLFRDSECSGCHRPPLFSDLRFDTIGLRPVAEDPGRQNVSNDNRDRGAFKVPSLRNVGLRLAHMHVGWISSIEDALDFYNSGTHDTGHEIFTGNLANVRGAAFDGQNLRINDIDFVATASLQRSQLVDFLSNALTDPRVASETFPFDRPQLASERRELSQSGQALMQDLAQTVATQLPGYTSSTTTFGSLFSVNDVASVARSFTSNERLSISTVLDIADDDIGKEADIYIIAYYNNTPYMRRANGSYAKWNGAMETLQPYLARASLSNTETVPVVSNLKNLPGFFSVYLAYLTDDSIVFSSTPVSFSID